MRIGIYGAGQFVSHINTSIPYIAVDGGILSLKKLQIVPKYIVGDFDSYQENDIEMTNNVIQLPCRKDYSDTEVAVQYAIELGYDEIEVYGVCGGRLDHFFGVIRLLAKYKDVVITIYDDMNKIVVLKPGTHTINKSDYDYISFYALDEVHLSLKGVEYPLENYLVTYDCTLCLSNEIVDDKCEVINDNYIYCIQSRKGE